MEAIHNSVFHVTTVTHDSRSSERMIRHKVRQLRDHGLRPFAQPVWLEPYEEVVIAQTLIDIIMEDNLKVMAFNVCCDHFHLLLVCINTDLSSILQKIKAKTAREVNIAKGITVPMINYSGSSLKNLDESLPDKPSEFARKIVHELGELKRNEITWEHAHLQHLPVTSPHILLPNKTLTRQGTSLPLGRGKEQHALWAQKFNRQEITNEKQLHATLKYIKNNRVKHKLEPNRALEYLLKHYLLNQHLTTYFH